MSKDKVIEPHTPSGIEWRQKIHRALGGQLGAVCYTLEEAVEKIEGLRESRVTWK